MRNYELLSDEVNMIGILKARSLIGRYLNRTNLIHYSELSRLVGCEIFVKHENHNPTGSFKIRGALNFFHHMSGEEVETGVLVSTRGNHGLAIDDKNLVVHAAQVAIQAHVQPGSQQIVVFRAGIGMVLAFFENTRNRDSISGALDQCC